jgi:cellulose synthase/poly-beta-1,6-N-acetylglucosamine synthase-like glycosyltransferase
LHLIESEREEVALGTLVIKIIYTACLVMLFMFSMNSLGLSLLYLKNRKKVWGVPTPDMKVSWPKVTIQLPTFNERYMIDRLLKAVTKLDYPADKFQIQVLDDSIDSTKEVIAKAVAHYQRQGINIQLIHRNDRSGYKAGALEAGLRSATGEFVAVFDADFLPQTDWLKKVVPFFQDNKVAFVQTRWGHINNRYNIITHLIGMALDAHFVVEQTARAGSGLLMSFNGTAGMWRVKAIEEGGGWQGDTLTEDIDLSFRTEMAGWKYIYAPDIVVMSELPAQMDAFKKQQVRWVKGNMQVTRKLMGKLIRSNIPIPAKIMGMIHLLMLFMPYPATVVTMLLTFPISLLAPKFLTLFSWTMIGFLGPIFLYCLAKTEFNPNPFKRILTLPFLTLIGVGISVNCSWGILTGFSSKSGVFERTPKYNLLDSHEKWACSTYALPISPVTAVELLMGIYLLTSSLYLYREHSFAFPAWQIVSAAAFLLVAGASIWQSAQRAIIIAHEKNLQGSGVSN